MDRSVRHDPTFGQLVVDIDGYDPRGRPTGRTWTFPAALDDLAGSYTVGYGYDRADHQTTVSYPAVGGLGAETVTTSFSNVTGTPVTMAGADQYVFSSSFDNRNRVTQRVLGDGTNGVKRTYGFDTHQRKTSWVATDMANVVIQSDQYTIDPVGNVTQRHDTVAGQRECYGYDTRNRLTRAYTTTNTACGTANTGGPDPYDHTYSYAPDGKMLSRDEGAGPIGYTYPTQGPGSVRPHAVSAIGTDTYAYDPNGR